MATSPRLDAALLSVPKGEAGAAPAEASSTALPAGRVAFTLRITPELHERLRRMAFEQRRPMQDLILEAVARWLDG